MRSYILCVCCYTVGSSCEVKREGNDGSSAAPVTEPPKHMGENVHVFECLQDFDTRVASKVGTSTVCEGCGLFLPMFVHLSRTFSCGMMCAVSHAVLSCLKTH